MISLKPVYSSADQAVADIFEGATIMVAGFARPGVPQELVKALIRKGVGKLTVIANAAHGTREDLADAGRLVAAGLVRKVITSFPAPTRASVEGYPEKLYRQGKLEVETVPQGTLSERIRAGGIGLGGFWVRTGVGTVFEEGKEKRLFNGQEHILERPLRADFALLRARVADALGNLVYDKAQRNFNPTMAMAAAVTIVEVDEVVEPGGLDSESIATPGIFIDRIVKAQSG